MSRLSPAGRRRAFVPLSHSTMRSSTNTAYGTVRVPLPRRRRARRGDLAFEGQTLACGRRDVAEHPPLRVDEDNAVSGGVAGVIFHFLSGNRDAAPEGNGADGAMSGDDGDVVVGLDL